MEKKKKGRKGLIALAAALALILLLGLCAWIYYEGKLGLIRYDDGSRELDISASVPADDLDLPDMGEAPQDAEERGKLPQGEAAFDSDVVNILLLGTDERSEEFSDNARADSILLLSLNTRLHTIKLVSIERGIGVPVPGRNDDWITHTFRYGGAALTLQTVRDCFKVDVDRYVRVNFSAFEKAIDVVGGVDIVLTPAEAAYINKEKDRGGDSGVQSVRAGSAHLNGKTALIYARTREIDSDWQRIERQRNVIQATVNEVKGEDIFTLNRLADEILPMVQTNLTKGEITSLLLEAPGFISQGAQIEQMTIPTYETCWNSVGVDGRKLIGVDFAANAEILQRFFYEGE